MLNKFLTYEYLFALLLLTSASAAAAETAVPETTEVQDGEFYFDQNMLVGGGNVENLNLLKSTANVAPGEYQVDIYLNGEFVSNRIVEFKADARQNGLSPCLDKQYLADAGVLTSEISNIPSCSLPDLVTGATTDFKENELRLNLFVPQAKMRRTPRGAVPASSLDAGNSMLFLNYDANYYRSRSSGQTSDSGYVGLNSGFNLGLWQLRQQSNFTSYQGSGSRTNKFKSLNTYLQRPLLGLQSQMTLGDVYTSGSQFGSLGMRGAKLASDDRMLPDSQRGYAPTIRGIANTNAKVVVKQSGNVIYQTSVPPGDFAIDDLYPTNYQGDLDVEIQEADGRISSFTVPFSAVPESVRPGQFKYDLALGRVRNISNSNDFVADIVGRFGISNNLTLSTGVRGAEGYRAALLGTVFTNTTGAYGVNAIYSNAEVPDKGTQNGWRFSLNYSKTFTPTNTNIALAAFRYSTKGFYDLSDVLGLRAAQSKGSNWVSSSYQQKNQFTATVSQSLDQYGHIYFSGSTSNYRGGRSNDTQLQTGYNFSLNNVSYSLSYSRQKTGRTYYGTQNDANTAQSYNGSTENVIMFSFSMPLGGSNSWSTSYSRQSGNSKGYQLQSSLSGSAGAENSLSYGITAAYDDQQYSSGEGSLSGSLQKRFANVTMGATAATGRNYTQGGLSARGAAVLHGGGLSLGPYLSDSFALVEAKGAEGAVIKNAQGARIGSNGYALMPSLTPYRFNEVVLDPQGISNNNIELESQSSRIAPYAGAMVKVKVKTTEGYPLLLSFDQNMYPLALGEDVYDDAGNSVGMVSQGGMIYARAKGLKGVLYTRGAVVRCALPYEVSDKTAGQPLYRATTVCKRG